MNKEEIENIEKIKKMLNFTTEGTSLRINNEVSKLLLKYMQILEQKEAILDKVTDKLKKDANKKIPLAEDMDWVRCRKEHAREILNIIEGEKK